MIIKFERDDIFINTIKTKPHFKFSIYNGQASFRGDFADTVPKGFAGINDLNLAAFAATTCSYSYDFSQECNSQYLSTI